MIIWFDECYLCDRFEHPRTHPHSLLYVLYCENSFWHMAVRMAIPNQTEKHATRHGCAHGHAKSDRKTCNQAWPCVPWSLKKKFRIFPHKAVIVHMLFHFPKSFHFPIPFLFPIPRVCKFLTNFFIFQLLEYLNSLSFTNSFLYLITHLIPLSSFITQFHLFQFLSFFHKLWFFFTFFSILSTLSFSSPWKEQLERNQLLVEGNMVHLQRENVVEVQAIRVEMKKKER